MRGALGGGGGAKAAVLVSLGTGRAPLHGMEAIEFSWPKVILFIIFNPFMPTVPTFAVRETNVSRHNGGTSGAPLKPLRDDSARTVVLQTCVVRL